MAKYVPYFNLMHMTLYAPKIHTYISLSSSLLCATFHIDEIFVRRTGFHFFFFFEKLLTTFVKLCYVCDEATRPPMYIGAWPI